MGTLIHPGPFRVNPIVLPAPTEYSLCPGKRRHTIRETDIRGCEMRKRFQEGDVKKTLIIWGAITGLALSLSVSAQGQQQAGSMPAKQATGEIKATRDIKVVSSPGVRGLADGCGFRAEQKTQSPRLVYPVRGGNL